MKSGRPAAAGSLPAAGGILSNTHQTTTTMPLQDKSILIDLSLHSFATSRTDARVSGEVLMAKSATGDSGRWVTKLLPKEATHPIAQLDGQIRKTHRQQTLPWSDKGPRILPSANFDSYMQKMRQLRHQREELVQAFRRTYPIYLDQARRTLGALYNPANYPSAEEAAHMFEFRINATPVPHENDFRIQLNSPAELQSLQRDLQTQIKNAENNAVTDLFQRIAEPLARMAERLSDPEAKFRNTLVTNLTEIADLIPSLNVTNNPRLNDIHQTIRSQLAYYTPDALRNSPADRNAAASKAAAILTQAQAWMNPSTQSQAA